MAFDPNLDKALFKEEIEFENSIITVSIMSYNEGTPKLQVSRESKDAEGNRKFAKLGRMTKEEAQKVIPIMQDALNSM